LQRRERKSLVVPEGMRLGSARVSALRGVGKFVMEETKKAGTAEEIDMSTVELQRILGYLNIGLAIAHDSGVSIGHFGCGDFIQLAQTVNGMLLHSIVPATSAAASCVTGSDTAPAGVVFAV
jgi:hypothetical protein